MTDRKQMREYLNGQPNDRTARLAYAYLPEEGGDTRANIQRGMVRGELLVFVPPKTYETMFARRNRWRVTEPGHDAPVDLNALVHMCDKVVGYAPCQVSKASHSRGYIINHLERWRP